ncbi:MAG: GPP34 family phosphoprotein [Mariniphaga sp.]|nr:GPP34 family phosphoprotein [Mariniphaga sp.]
MEKSTSLSEKLYLLSVHPQKGGILFSAGTAFNYASIGALVLELVLEKNIAVEDKRVKILGLNSKNSLHRFMLDKMKEAKKPFKVSRWIHKFNFSFKHIRREIESGLVQKRMIRLEEKRFLFFRWKKPFVLNKQVVIKLQSDVENQILQGTGNEEEIMLLTLIKPCGLLKRVVPDKDKRKIAGKKLKQMMEENQVSEAVSAAVAAAHAVAISVAASSAAVAASASR